MTTPTLMAAHSSRGRTRLRANGHLGQAAAFEQVAEGLSKLHGVERVEANPLTRGILVVHANPLEELAAEAHAQGLAEIALEPPRPPPRRQRMVVHTDADRVEARRAMRGLGAVSLLGLSMFQGLRGDVLPAALPLFMQALILFKYERPPEPLG